MDNDKALRIMIFLNIILMIIIVFLIIGGYIYIEAVKGWLDWQMMRAESLWKQMCYNGMEIQFS